MSCIQARWGDSCQCSEITQYVLMSTFPMVKADTLNAHRTEEGQIYSEHHSFPPPLLISKSEVQMDEKSAESGKGKENSSFSSSFPSPGSSLWSWAFLIQYIRPKLPAPLSNSNCMT